MGSVLLSPLLALVCAACYREAAPLDTPESRLRWARELLPTPEERDSACGALGDEPAIIARAISRSPRVAALEGEARFLRAAAETSLGDAPQLRLDNVRLDQMIDGPGRFELGVRVPFERPGTLDAQADAFRQEALAAEAEAREEARRIALDVRVALARHGGWMALAALAGADLEAVQAEVARLRSGVATGQVLAAELARAEVLAIEAEGEAARAEAEAARFLATVKSLVGRKCTVAVGTLAGAHDDVPSSARDALVDEALAQRPGVALRAARLRLSAARTWEARAATWPWLSWAQIGYELTDDPSPRTWIFSIALDLPIGAWDGAEVDAAEIDARAASEAARREVQAIVAEVDAALTEVSSRRDQLAALERARRRLDPRRLAELEGAAATGQLDPSELFRLRRQLRELDERRIEALIELAEARARLLATLGR